MLRFTVYGTPAPQGSSKAFMRQGMRHPVVTADCERTKPWRDSIVGEVRSKLPRGWTPIDCPCHVRLVFYMPRPASAPKRVTKPAKLPDLDKLQRATFDALTTSGCWKDDARVIEVWARKVFAAGLDDPLADAGIPRVEIEVVW